eukprot:Pompholyxophrys_punicea_v1_NODE_708_length_1416_cov_25.707568.p1 type:complete len:373 gc:universal NODE_708_length_1416_cov_25.707568:254-1372(+)
MTRLPNGSRCLSSVVVGRLGQASRPIKIQRSFARMEGEGEQEEEQQNIFQLIFDQHATFEVRVHAVYAVLVLGMTRKEVAYIFGKGANTIGHWVARYQETGTIERRDSKTREERYRRLLQMHRNWIVEFIRKDPLCYLHEICAAFKGNFGIGISDSSVYSILTEAGYTKKVLERIAKEIKVDEFSTDNRSMLRKRGWFLRGERPIFRSYFRRGTRISMLAFLGVDGFVDFYDTEGTFDRHKFLFYCDMLLDSGKIQPYPGRYSIWCLDGASIHLDANMISYLTSRRIVIVFFPAYAPFFSPIEVVFGQVKKECRNIFKDCGYGDEKLVLYSVMNRFTKFNCTNIFRHCGFTPALYFTPHTNYRFFLETADLL